MTTCERCGREDKHIEARCIATQQHNLMAGLRRDGSEWPSQPARKPRQKVFGVGAGDWSRVALMGSRVRR